MKTALLLPASVLLTPVLHAANLLDNSSFESTPSNFVDNYNSGNVVNYYDTDGALGDNTNRLSGWQTTATDEKIEIWNSSNTVLPNTDAFIGNNYAEVNATQEAELYQEVTITNGDIVDYVFYHRARNLASEQLRFRITDLGIDGIFNGYDAFGLPQGDDSQETDIVTTADTIEWVLNYGDDAFTANGNNYRFGFETVAGTTNSLSEGNFLDNLAFGVGVADSVAVPEPSSSLLILFSSATLLRRHRKSN